MSDIWYTGRPPGADFVRDESACSWDHSAVWDNGETVPMFDSLKEAIIHFRPSIGAYELWAIGFDLMGNAYLDGNTGIAVVYRGAYVHADMSTLNDAVIAATNGEESWL